ncbi:transposase [Shewanella xiamenensis]|uniref:transposase n=1 Tax=Shewanella xiamenensis TaxID=332186 RepID=UPI00217F10B9|nr:transposase [Shewanella xiamenensis]MCT8861364.1 transposase [Shewanella xiamenensis]UWG63431.1 transposase [Shewanella xiamenensis]
MPVYTYQSSGTASVGIDLGCKEAATDSNGDGVTGRQYRKLERPLGIAQRGEQTTTSESEPRQNPQS